MAKEYRRQFRTESVFGWARDIPLYDDFTPALFKWLITATGAGTGTRDTGEGHIGEASMKHVTAATQNASVDARRFLGAVEKELIRASFFWLLGTAQSQTMKVEFDGFMTTREESKTFGWGIRITMDAEGDATIFTTTEPGGVYTELVADVVRAFREGWVEVAVIMNLKTQRLVSVQIGGSVYDASDRIMAEGDVTNQISPAEIFLLSQTLEAVVKTNHFDQVIVEYV